MLKQASKNEEDSFTESKNEEKVKEDDEKNNSSSDSDSEKELKELKDSTQEKIKRVKTIEGIDKLASSAVSRLARSVLEKVKEIFYQVKDKITFLPARSSIGYRITIPLNDKQNIVIRIMEKGGKSLFFYYRIVINNAETYTKGGLSSSKVLETHIPLSIDSLIDIIKIVMKIWSEKWKN